MRYTTFLQGQKLDGTGGRPSRNIYRRAPAPPVMETIAEMKTSTGNWEKGGAKVDTFDGFS